MDLIVAVIVLAHLSQAAVCFPLIRRRVAPNSTYGFRTPQTLANERVWYDANAAAGRYFLVAAGISAVLCAVCLVSIPAPASLTAVTVVYTATILGAAGASFVALRKMLR